MVNYKHTELVPVENRIALLQYQRGVVSIDPWGSHQPALVHLLNTITKGDVFEFGMGLHSTHIMHTICREQGRKLLSIEYDAPWFSKFEQLKDENHDMFLYDIDSLLTKSYPFFKRHFSVAFIDGSPGEIRQPLITLMKANVDYFIVHDTEQVANNLRYPKDAYSYGYDFSGFKYVSHFKCGKSPTTSILSNVGKINLHD